MRQISFDFLGQHRHGQAFHDYLKLRKTFFVDSLGWEIPHNDEVEMDQYDNPCAHYSLVLLNGKVVGGARIMATTASWGEHTYMLRDALRGSLKNIPPSVMEADIATDRVWECTRLVVSDDLRSATDRANCLGMVVEGLAEIANRHGGVEMLALTRPSLVRTLRALGFAANRSSEPYRNENDGRQYAVLNMPTVRPAQLYAAE